MLCVHGMTSSRLSWTRLAARLGDRFRVAAYDQRGHGDSAGVHGPMTLERGVRDLENVYAQIGQPVDALLGHSWGGAIAIRGGVRLPVHRVAAIDPMIRQCDDAWYQEYVGELRDQFALAGAARDEAVRTEYSAWSPEDVEGKVHAVHHMTSGPIEMLWRQNPPELWDLRPDLASYGKPLLLALPPKDGSINDPATLDDVERDHSATVEIATIEAAGHNLHRTHFAAFAPVLEAFLTGG
ncbi:MAG: alpha/beta fold hydrolase [Vulcanimicrobiaceae bacterium]